MGQLGPKRLGFRVVDEVAVAAPQSVMAPTMRSITCRSESSRSGVPSVPRKYFWARMLVAFCDQLGRYLDAELFERNRSVAVVGQSGVAAFPRDVVVGIASGTT